MRNIRVKVAYDGSGYCGWQVQPDQPTIQGALESVLAGIEGQPVAVAGSGRTDAGVHALGQVATFPLANPIPVENLQKAMNRLLPEAIRIVEVAEAPTGFHARYSATAKLYEYRIWREEICPPTLSRYVYPHPYPLDEAAMRQAAPEFEGTHDFRSLAAGNAEGKESTIRTIFSSTLERQGSLLVYRVRGSGFLHHMVRNIVGVLLEVGRGVRAPGGVAAILAARQRAAAGSTVPARGLFLVEVEYGED
jgi:tRNA pseudouridine38-40 synthase